MNNENNTRETHPSIIAPPKPPIGVLKWLKDNLFSSWINTLLTILFAGISVFVLIGSIEWIFLKADWHVIAVNLKLLVVGQYPVAELWRIWICLTLISILMGLSSGIWKGTMGHLSIAIAGLYLIVVSLPFVMLETRYWLLGNIAAMVLGYLIGKNQSKF